MPYVPTDDDDRVDEEIDRDLGWDTGRTARLRKAAADPLLVRIARWPLRAFMAVGRGVCKIVFFPIFSPPGFTKHFDVDGNERKIRRPLIRRMIDGMLVRVLILPVFLAVFFLAIVWQTTHPKPLLAKDTPAGHGIFFKRITLTSADGQDIQAWCIPPFSAEQVMAEREGMMERQYPAVVLVHGLGFSHDQYMNLAEQLHRADVTVLMLDTRGQGESPPATVTFGVRERMDVACAVNYVRDLSYTDPDRLGVVGYGPGGSAALQAAALDPSIAAVVADAVHASFDDELARALANPWIPTDILAAPYQGTFELTTREHLRQLNLAPVVAGMHHASILFIARAGAGNDKTAEEAAVLAGRAGCPHHVVACSGGLDETGRLADSDATRVVEFLCKGLHWTGGERSAAVRELLNARVK
jgi:pimeloyl-ACP methyl ester carboxylesterase